LGNSTSKTIAGEDFRIFSISLQETVHVIPHIPPPAGPKGRILTLPRYSSSIKREILYRPTFFQHYDSVLVSWELMRSSTIIEEAGWIQSQKLNVIVDLSYGINLFPTLSMLDNIPWKYPINMEKIITVLKNMNIIGSSSLILSLHRSPENNFNDALTYASFVQTVQFICGEANNLGITVHLRHTAKNFWKIGDLNLTAQFVDAVGVENLFIVPNTGLLLAQGTSEDFVDQILDSYVQILSVTTPVVDIVGNMVSESGLIAHYSDDEAPILSNFVQYADKKGISLICDAVFFNLDQEYLDTKALNELLIM